MRWPRSRNEVRNCEKAFGLLKEMKMVQHLLAKQRREDPLVVTLDPVVRQH